MKFICDVHISFKLVSRLKSLGYEALHVNELRNKWYSSDDEIRAYADLHDLILITKDYDFKNSYFVHRSPCKLIKIKLGNISNQQLIEIITDNLQAIEKLNGEDRFMVEIDKDLIVFIRDDKE